MLKERLRRFNEYIIESARQIKADEWPGAAQAQHYSAKDARKTGHLNVQKQLAWNLYPGKFRYIGTAHGHHHYHSKTPGGAERIFYHKDEKIAKAGASKYAHTGRFHSLQQEDNNLRTGTWAYQGVTNGKHVFHSRNIDDESKTWSHEKKIIAQKAAEAHSFSHGAGHGNHLHEGTLDPGHWTFSHQDNQGQYHFRSKNLSGIEKIHTHSDEMEGMRNARHHAELDEMQEVKSDSLEERHGIEVRKGGIEKIEGEFVARHKKNGEVRYFRSKKLANDFLKTKIKKIKKLNNAFKKLDI
jgi:hypothetical protein